MHHGITSALLGCFLWLLGIEAGNAEWYKVPAGGQVAFTLSEEWGIFKGPPPSSIVFGVATVTLEYLDGSTQQIAFQDSETAIGIFIASNPLGTSGGRGVFSGTNVFTQTASLPPGTVFSIVSSSPAQLYNPDVAFQGGQEGAYIKGFTTKLSTDAPPVTSPSDHPPRTFVLNRLQLPLARLQTFTPSLFQVYRIPQK